MTFNEWFSTHEWWKENSRRDDFGEAWDALALSGVGSEKIAAAFDRMVSGMRDEYGD